MRVLLASEYPKMSHFLEGVVLEENGNVVVGHAENVTRALTLARKLRPDVIMIDCDLPHNLGIKNISMSRAGGLDAAQIISAEIPNSKVMVLNNLDNLKLPEFGWGFDTQVSFAGETTGNSAALTLRGFSRESKNGLVFASVEVKKKVFIKQRVLKLSDEVIFFGGFGILSGLIMMVTLILIIPGIFLVAAGSLAVLSGFLSKLVFRKIRGEDKE